MLSTQMSIACLWWLHHISRQAALEGVKDQTWSDLATEARRGQHVPCNLLGNALVRHLVTVDLERMAMRLWYQLTMRALLLRSAVLHKVRASADGHRCIHPGCLVWLLETPRCSSPFTVLTPIAEGIFSPGAWLNDAWRAQIAEMYRSQAIAHQKGANAEE